MNYSYIGLAVLFVEYRGSLVFGLSLTEILTWPIGFRAKTRTYLLGGNNDITIKILGKKIHSIL